MKKMLSLVLAALMLFALCASGAAAEKAIISPEAESRFTKVVLMLGSGKRIELSEEEINGYYILLYSEETSDERMKNIFHTLYPNGEAGGIVTRNIPAVFGADYSDHNLLDLFRVDRIGTPVKHDRVEFSLYIPNAVDGNSYEMLADVNNSWKKVKIVDFKNGVFTFEVPYEEAVTNYALLYKRSKTSPQTGMDCTALFLMPVALLCVLGCAYTGKKALFD